MLVLGAGEAMRRGEFIALFGSTAATLRLAARAQPHAKVPFIGFLGLAPEYSGVDALRAGLRDLGYIEDGNVVIMWRWAEHVEQLPGSPPSWLLCLSRRPPARRPRRFPSYSPSMPIPSASGTSQVLRGRVETSRGMSMLLTELAAKGLEVLMETVPEAIIGHNPQGGSGHVNLPVQRNAST